MSGLETLIATYGLAAIVVGTFVEGETIVVLAGLAAHRGYLPLHAVILAAFAGTFAGDQLYFYLGRWRGASLLERRPGWAARVERTRRVLDRHHVAFILGFRFLYGLRTVSPFVIGMSGVSRRRFLLLNTLGGLAWSVSIVMLGYLVGESAEALLGQLHEVEVWLFAGVAAVGLGLWLAHLLRRRAAGQRP